MDSFPDKYASVDMATSSKDKIINEKDQKFRVNQFHEHSKQITVFVLTIM